jgi:hypothetical protein
VGGLMLGLQSDVKRGTGRRALHAAMPPGRVRALRRNKDHSWTQSFGSSKR